MNNVLVAYLYKPGNVPSLCALMLHLRAVTKVTAMVRKMLASVMKPMMELTVLYFGKVKINT